MRKKVAIILFLGTLVSLWSPMSGWSGNKKDAAKPKKADTIESIVMPGKVIQGHAKYEFECKRCHRPFRKGIQVRLCLDCHKKVAGDVDKGRGFHGLSKQVKDRKCKQCHTEHKGRDADVVRLNKELFDHGSTDFPLGENHLKLKCAACHKPKVKYRDTPSKCMDCHRKNEPHLGRLGEKCIDCHKGKTWKKYTYDHNKTKFALKGKHLKVQCALCHPSQRWKKTPMDCYACHRINEPHGGRFGAKCEQCHTPEDWKKPFHDHSKTKFPLKGKHQKVKCYKCHTGKPFKKEKKPDPTCFGCHKNDDEHKGIYDKKCEKCHTPKDWKKTKHDHSKTKFQLKGKHQKLKCSKCHKRPINEKKPGMACYDCHRHDDVHKGQEKNRCERCHNQRGWRTEVFFDHDLTDFPLIGQHAIAPCEECHLGNAFRDTKKECIACHKPHDKHKQRLGPACDICHNPNGWNLWQFNHDTRTKYPLKDAHAGLECTLCHKNPVKKKIRMNRGCFNCHHKDDAHRGAFGRPCGRCHTTKSFKEIQIRH